MNKVRNLKQFTLLKFMKNIGLLRFVTLCALLCTIQISAMAYAEDSTLDISLNDVSLKDVVHHLQRKTDYSFVYSVEDIQNIDGIDIDLKDSHIEDVLDRCIEGRNLEYIINEKVIVIKAAELKTKAPKANQQSKQRLTGRITDNAGDPIVGASIYIQDSSVGIVSDVDGNYTLSFNTDLNPEVIVYSFIGKKTQEVKYVDQEIINIILLDSEEALNEVVVTGYQTILRERSSGSYDRVDGKIFQDRPNPDIATTMEGSVAGFQRIATTNADGSVSYEYSIRGQSTLTSSIAQPLIVVDGFPIDDDFSSIDPNIVKSVTVLKDAAAASIWGARAANGVIVVVTTSGENSGKVKVSGNAMMRFSPMLDLDYVAPKASTETQVEWEKYVYDNGLTGNLNPSSVQDITTALSPSLSLYNEFQLGNITEAEYTTAINKLTEGNYKDDVEEYLMQSSKYQQYSLGISGSSNKNSYSFSALYDKTESYFVGTGSSKTLFNFKDIFNVNKHISFNAGATLKIQETTNNGATLYDIKRMAPYQEIVDENGDYVSMVKDYYLPILDSVSAKGAFPYDDWTYNLLQESETRDRVTDNITMRVQAGVKIDFLKHFSLNSNFQYEINNSDYTAIYDEESYLVRNQVNKYNQYDDATGTVTSYSGVGYAFPEGDAMDQSSNRNNNFVFRNQLNWDQSFNKRHHFIVLVGSEISQYVKKSNTHDRIWGYDDEKLTYSYQPFYNDYGAYTFYSASKTRLYPGVNNSSSESDNRFFSIYGNLSYNFDDKYTLTGSVRTDASNMIVDDPSYRYAPFWSVGGRWAAEKESFLEDVTFIDRLQVRGSYGISGNVVTSTSIMPLISYSSSPLSYTGEYYATVNDFGNPLLRWEKTKIANIGVDFSFFKNKLHGEIEVYSKKGEDILADVDVAAVYGIGYTTAVNAAELSNTGYEIELGTSLNIVDDLNWTGKLIFFGNKNEVTKLNVNGYYAANLESNSKYVQGATVSPIYSYIYKGVNEEGIPMVQFEDGAETEIFNIPSVADARTFMKYEGSSIPVCELGFDHTFSYKGLSLRMLISGKFGHYFRAEAPNYSMLNNAGMSTLTQAMNDVVSGTSDLYPGMPPASAPDVSTYSIVKYFDTLVESASNVRLKDVTLAYALPQSVLGKANISRLRVFVQAKDLGVIWKATDTSYDPDYPTYKPSASYTLGVNLNF